MTSLAADPRSAGAMALGALESALTAPLAAAMRTDRVAIEDGTLRVARQTRDPFILVGLARGLAQEALVVEVMRDGVATHFTFAPYTGAGAMLPVHLPPVTPSAPIAEAFTLDVRAWLVSGAAASASPVAVDDSTLLDADALSGLVEGVVLEGTLGRLLFLGALEKQRIHRQARLLRAGRHIELGTGALLDALGQDLGVPRFSDTAEDDVHYRARLALFRPWQLPTPAGVDDALNGPAADDGTNRGLPARVGVTARFEVVEEQNPITVALRLVAVGDVGTTQRDRYLALLRSAYLFDLDRTAPAVADDAGARWDREEWVAVRDRLRVALTRAEADTERTRYLAPLLATTLDRYVRVLQALGEAGGVTLRRTFDPDAAQSERSRYELGLGARIRGLTAATLTRLGRVVTNGEAATDDAEVAAVIAGLAPRDTTADPNGLWLLNACGFTTVEAVTTTDLFVAPVALGGVVLDGPTELAAGTSRSYRVQYVATPGSSGLVPLAEAARDATPAAFTARAVAPAPTALTPDALATRLQAAATSTASAPATLADHLAVCGFVAAQAAKQAEALRVSANLAEVVGYSVTRADLEALGDGVDAWLAGVASALIDAGFYAYTALWDAPADALLILGGVATLPGALTAPGQVPGAVYYWEAFPIGSTTGRTTFARTLGSAASVTGAAEGLTLLSAFTYQRRGFADPFQFKVGLPEGEGSATLTADQYEYVMNLLEQSYPLAIGVDTYDLRRRHVDIAGDGTTEWLSSDTSRTYRRYWRRRLTRRSPDRLG